MDRMDDLVQFLRARLDEDAAAASQCAGDGQWTPEAIAFYGPDLSPEVRGHMARHDPARVLAEVDAKRKLLTEYEEVQHDEDASYEWAGGWTNGLRHAAALLALPYATPPDYRDTWRP